MMATFNESKLRHRGRLERWTALVNSEGKTVQDPMTGEISYDWVEIARLWMAIEPLSAREFVQSAAVQSQVNTRLTIRARGDIAAKDRIVHVRLNMPDVVYNIVGVLPDLDSNLEYMTLPATTGVNEG